MFETITTPPAGSLVAYAWLLPWLIATSAGLLIVLGKRCPRGKYLGTATALLAALYTTGMFIQLNIAKDSARTFVVESWDWVTIGGLNIRWDLLIDPLTIVMLMLVTWVGFLVHVFSLGYMDGDENITRFFGFLNLFIASMMLLLVGANYLTLFVGWELVGLCSYLLVGFWFTNAEYAKAAKKAFIVNRIGDVGFLLAMFLLYKTFGTLDIATVNTLAASAGENATDHSNLITHTIIVLLLFVGATAKSAQIPLYIWLPDAMAGPTPVSALIHAATMVTAGVYLFARSTGLVTTVLHVFGPVIFWVGILTATSAALTACFVYDFKKILAWSTISQLGYMFVAIGVGANTAAIFHLVTHGFFKALLFLTAGSVMHALANDTDIRHAGGLLKVMPYTGYTAAIGVAAIAGIPGLSGFFSKEEILHGAATTAGAEAVWVIGIGVALLTAFYMSRWFILLFLGKPRWKDNVTPHESPATMTIPLVILAVLAALGGALNVHPEGWLGTWFAHIFAHPEATSHAIPHILIMPAAITAAIAGIGFAWYKFKTPDMHKVAHGGGVFGDAARSNFYWDAQYEAFNARFAPRIAKMFNFADVHLLDGFVHGVKNFALMLAQGVRNITTGTLRHYVAGVVVGILMMFAITILASFGGM